MIQFRALSKSAPAAMDIILVSLPDIQFLCTVFSLLIAAAVLLAGLYFLISSAMRVVAGLLESPPRRDAYVTSRPSYLKCGDVSGESFREEDCAICLERLMEGSGSEVAALFICEHIFHVKCLMKWTRTSRSCPMCRRHVDSAYVFKLLGSTQYLDNSPIEQV